MAETTKIQWTDHTFNPWRGCTKVSQGCANCYAETQSKRNPRVLGIWGPQGTRVLASEHTWREPAKWSGRVFCASLADVFEDWRGGMTDSAGHAINVVIGVETHEGRPWITERRPYTLNDARERLWRLIRETPALTWQILTRRPENIARMMPHGDWPNVWLVVSVEDQENTWRCDALQEAAQVVKVPVLGISAEPLLGPLDLSPVLGASGFRWVIVGGESGGGARPMLLEWVRHLRDQCAAAGAACFVKQLGAHPRALTGTGLAEVIVLDDRKGGDWDEWPADIQVREFPS